MVNHRGPHQLSQPNLCPALFDPCLLAGFVRVVWHVGGIVALQPRTLSTGPFTLEIHDLLWADARDLQFDVDILCSI